MPNRKIIELQRVFTSRLAVLEHVLDIGEKHFGDAGAFMDKRLAEDMLPFGAQVAFACNAPRGFSQIPATTCGRPSSLKLRIS